MKNILILSVFVFCFLANTALIQSQVDSYKSQYYHPELEYYLDEHKSVAVLPMEVVFIDRKLSSNNDSEREELEQKEKDMQTKLQRTFYKRLLWLKSKNKLKEMEVQDTETTNKLLQESGIENIEDLASYKYDDIALMLGVDALIGGEIEIVQKRSLAGSIALSMVTDVNHSTDDSTLAIKILSGNDGKLIWQHYTIMSNKGFSKTEKLIERMVDSRLDKSFPYHIKF